MHRAVRLSGVAVAALALVVATVLAALGTASSVPTRLNAWRMGEGANGGANAYQNVLLGVDCARVAHCVAVGYASVLDPDTDDAAEQSFAEVGNGTTWRAVAAPTVSGVDTRLVSVSCVTPSECVAVGSYVTTSESPAGPVVAVWNGTAWRGLSIPQALTTVVPSAVSCASATVCVAVADEGHAFRLTRGAGGSWSMAPSTYPLGDRAHLLAVSCPTVRYCLAVGDRSEKPNGVPDSVFSARYDGTRWAQVAGINGKHQAPIRSNVLSSISCLRPTWCEASGQYLSELPSEPQELISLLEHWNGKKWVLQASGDPLGADGLVANAEPAGVSCAATWACSMVGWWLADYGDAINMVETWNGATWRYRSSPNHPQPDGSAPDNAINAVSCAAPSWCVAVGEYPTGWLVNDAVTARTTRTLTLRGPAVTPHLRLWLNFRRAIIGTRDCLYAFVTDGTGAPLVGVPVRIRVTGVGRRTHNHKTNSAGAVSMCLVGRARGRSKIVVTVAGIHGKKRITWISRR